MGGPAGVLGRSSGGLGLAWGFMGGAWCVLGVAWSVLGGPWEVLERPSRRLWGIPPNRSCGVLGVDGEIGRDYVGSSGIKASPGRDSDAPMGTPDRLRTRSDRLGMRSDVSPGATRSSLDRPMGPRSAQGRPRASNVFPKSVQEMSIRAPVRGNMRKTDGF